MKSSLYYPRSNGPAGSAVKSVRKMIKNATDLRKIKEREFLVFRNTQLACGK